ncbi:Early nodulin-like protein 1 [Nymphaea thermarum]|nr:Early nodulin-like protein 1 [Nymphaea thermarum]
MGRSCMAVVLLRMASKAQMLLLLLLVVCRMEWGWAFEFTVGGDMGWAIPPANDTDMYNQWASKNRFQVGDTLHFKYKKDSVMVVSDTDYDMCNSSHPLFYYNNGKTDFKISQSGLLYFISGVSGHCEKGQKMIIKVLSGPASPSPGGSPSTPSPPGSNADVAGLLPTSATLCSLAASVLVALVAQ